MLFKLRLRFNYVPREFILALEAWRLLEIDWKPGPYREGRPHARYVNEERKERCSRLHNRLIDERGNRTRRQRLLLSDVTAGWIYLTVIYTCLCVH